MGSPILLIHPYSPSVLFVTRFPLLTDFDLPSVFHISLDLVIMILIKLRPLLPDVLPEKSLVSVAYFPETMILNDIHVLPHLVPDD